MTGQSLYRVGIRWRLLMVFVAALLVPVANAGESDLRWPAPPAEARIRFVTSFSTPRDLGIRKGFFRRVGEIFTGSDERRLVKPMSVVEFEGIIYVGDPGAKAVHRFDVRKNRYRLIQLADRQPLPSPVGLALDKQGRLYIVDSVLADVYTVDPGAKHARPVHLDGSLKQPTGIAIDRTSGALYIADTANHQVKVFDRSGKLLDSFGHRGNGQGEFNYPTMLWRDNGKLLVTDSLNFRIQTLTDKGEFVSSFGKLGNATGYLSRPKGVAVDTGGYVYVVDSLFHAMQIFDADGRLMLSIGRQGSAPGEFWLPTGIYIASDQKIYIADSHNQRVQVLEPVKGRAS